MSTLIASIVRRGRCGLAGRRAWVLAVPLLVTGALAVGCGQPTYGYPGGPASDFGQGPPTGTPPPAPPAAPTAPARALPQGPFNCAGWPAGLPTVPLSASFVPVSAELCVNGTETIPGKGLWTTATLERSTGDLSRLVNALRQPSASLTPGTVCPAIAVITPQIVLTDAAGDEVIPQLPVGDCGLPTTTVLAAINQLRWQRVSVRPIGPVPGAAPAVSGPAPQSTPTAGGAVHPG